MGWWILEPPDRPDQGRIDGQAEFGYPLQRRHWRKGLASEGARELIRNGFDNPGLSRIFAETMAANVASLAMKASAGMSYVRTFFLCFGDSIPGAEYGEVECAITKDADVGPS